MRIVALCCYAFSISAAAGLLAGCGAVQTPASAPDTLPQQRVHTASSSSGDLLYIGGDDEVSIVTYPQGKYIDHFDLQDTPASMCSDKHGNVFVGVPNTGILEYAHGGDSPIATLSVTGYPSACSVDPTTGNLAVASGDAIAIYPNAQDPPTYYSDPTMDTYFYCGYDNNGNLFVDGENSQSQEQSLKLTELSAGSSSFSDITLNKSLKKTRNGGTLQWLGFYLALTNAGAILHIAISGTTGTIVGKTAAKGLKNHWVVYGRRLISPYGREDRQPFEVAYWKYPKGGAPSQVINDRFLQVYNLAISVGSQPGRR
ncbi:MAG: hypothetical protein WBW89_12280 [Candidatus Cybelea sp.]